MTRIWITVTMLLASPAIAQSGDSAKYARCAGSTEALKCRALVDAITSETPEAKRSRIEKLDRERLKASQEAIKTPAPHAHARQKAIASEPAIGMSEYEAALTDWGPPSEKNRTVTQYGSREQWVYGEGRYMYLENGRVTAISTRR